MLLQQVQPIPTGFVSHVEPVKVSWSYKLLFASLAIFILFMVLVRGVFLRHSTSNTFWMFYFVFLLLLLALVIARRWPTKVELTATCVVLHTRLTTYSLPYERVVTVEMLNSICCFTGAACKFPKGGFTSFTSGVFFRTNDFGQSLAFSPQDPTRFLHQLQLSPLGNRIIAS